MGIALVTGGTSGIGAAFARALAERGDDLVLVARDADRLASRAVELSEHGVAVETLVADLSRAADVERVAARLSSTEEPVDLLISNAGFGVKARLTDADLAPHDYAIDVMIRAVLHLGAAAGRSMRERGRGHIVNVSSTAGYLAQGNYSAIKAWVTTYSESLAVELRGTGVGVTALCPGWVHTEFHSRANLRTSSIPSLLWLDADDLVREALRDVAAGKVISIPSRRYSVLITLARLTPRPVIRAVSGRISASRH
jgi:short-subunit dehydrogenase